MQETERDIEYTPTGAVLRQDISFQGWQEGFLTTNGIQRGANWWLGDILAYGEERFPDQWSQVLDAKFAEAHRGLLRVSRRIPREIRRESLSWSAHREAAAPETMEERIELLDLAEANGWGAREIAAVVKKRREFRQSNGGPPLIPLEDLPRDIKPLPDEVNDPGDAGVRPKMGPVPFLAERDRIVEILQRRETRLAVFRAIDAARDDTLEMTEAALSTIIILIQNTY